jgi:transcriptional regulator with XRE-family HTH domain
MPTDTPRQRLGLRLRTLRQARRLTQRELARRTGLAVPFLSRVENDRAEPSVRTLERLAAGLEVTLGDLIDTHAGPLRTVCPVSHSGRCVAELVLRPGPRSQVRGEAYTPRQVQVLRLANYLVQFGTGEVQASLELVMRAMLRLPGVRRDARWLRTLRSPALSASGRAKAPSAPP